MLAIMAQAVGTFFQYAKKPRKEQAGRTLAALMGLAPLIEGLSVWTGKEDPDLLFSGPMMYAFMKSYEIAFESIPESIIHYTWPSQGQGGRHPNHPDRRSNFEHS